MLVRTLALLGQLALWGLLLGFVALGALPRLTPFDVLVVRGGSMEPAVQVGSVVIVDRTAREPAQGSIVSIHDPQAGIVTHRVVAIDGDRFVTRGDANRTDDATRRTTDDVYGTVVATVPIAGYLIRTLQQPPVFLILLLGTGGLLIADSARTIIREVRRLRPRKELGDAS